MTLIGIDHVQLAAPPGGEAAARDYYVGLLGMAELTKPPLLAQRGGCWFSGGGTEIHIGIEDPFQPARKAHPGLLVSDLDALAVALEGRGLPVRWDDTIPGRRRFHSEDLYGNRLEFIAG
ncbi:MAG TPA: glyoxalase [Actinocrinis sp.]|nr:glyoxalase [Actinocrinis sp.]